MRNGRKIAVMTAMLLAAGAVTAADIMGTMVTKDNNRYEGYIQWNSRRKEYTVKQLSGHKLSLSLGIDKIDRLIIPKPQALDNAEDAMRKGGTPAAAIPVLEKIVDDYFMLVWDKRATRLLAEAYMQNNDAAGALKACERLMRDDPEAAYLGEVAPAYWKALLMADRPAKLSEFILKAIKTGDRSASAQALLMRGDLIRKEGDTIANARKALRDGYLRVITLYSGVKAVQPEALYKAAKCFEKLGQTSRADEMRTKLKEEYGSSSWALK